MARMRRRWRLDVYAEPTDRRPTVEDVAEALYALQIQATDMDAREMANTPLGAVVVALVKHQARQGGSWHVVELDDEADLSEGERPRIEEVS